MKNHDYEKNQYEADLKMANEIYRGDFRTFKEYREDLIQEAVLICGLS